MTTQTIRIVVDPSGAVAGASTASRAIGGIGNAAQGAQRGLGLLGAALGGLGLAAIASQAIKFADAMANVKGKISLVTTSTTQLVDVQNKLFEVSQRSRVGFEGVVDLYGSLARSTKSLGTSQKDLISVTETINKALIVSGASAATAQGALVQLGQGFASGTLRGDELNSVLEGTPRLAQAIADGMGVTVGQLRALGAQGKITGATVFNALKSQREAVESEFAKMPTTVSQALTVATNNLMQFVGAMDGASGSATGLAGTLSSSLGAAIVSISNNLNTIVPVVTGLAFALGVGYVTSAVAAALASTGAATAMGGLAIAARGVGASLLAAFGGPIGLAITAIIFAIGAVGYEMSKTSAMMAATDKTSSDLDAQMKKLKISTGEVAGQTGAVGTSADGATSGLAAMSASSQVLSNKLYETANAAKKARIEIAALQLYNAHTAEIAAQEALPQRRFTGYQKGNFTKNFGINFRGVVGDYGNFASGGQQDRDLVANEAKARANSAKAKAILDNALSSKNDVFTPVAGASGTTGKKAKDQTDARASFLADVAAKELALQNEAKYQKIINGDKEHGVELAQKARREDELAAQLKEMQLKAAKLGVSFDEARFKLAQDTLEKELAIAAAREKTASLRSSYDAPAVQREKLVSDLASARNDPGLQADPAALNRVISDLTDKLGELKSAVQKTADDLRSKYDGAASRLEELKKDRGKIDTLTANSTLGAEESKRIISENSRLQMEANFEVNKADRDAKRESVYAIADLFGSAVGDAVRKIANAVDAVSKGTFTGAELGGTVGKLTSVATALTGGAGGDFAKSVGASFSAEVNRDSSKPNLDAGKKLVGIFSKGGDALKGIGAAVGTALGGFEAGGAIADGLKGISDSLGLGIKISKIGGQIGGAIGSFLPIPFGKEIGAVVGAVIGGLFMKTPKASQTTSVDAYGQLVVGKAQGSKKLISQVDQLANGVADTLKNYQKVLGADLFPGLKIASVGAKGKDYVVDTSGQSRTKGLGVYNFKSAEDAMTFAVKDAVLKGIFTGISEFAQRVIKSGKDMERAVQLAGKYQSVLTELATLQDPITAPLKDLEDAFKSLRLEMADSGATASELANVDKYYNLQRKATMDSQLADLRTFKDAINGEGSGVTAFSRYQVALTKFSALEADAIAGKNVNQKDFITAGGALFDLTKSIYGTATQEFQSIRDRINASTDAAIGTVTATQDAASAAAPVVTAVQIANDDANKNHAELLAYFQATFGGGGGLSGLVQNLLLNQYVNGLVVKK